MLEYVNAIVDCRVSPDTDIDFNTLNMWGKPVFSYVLEELHKCDSVEKIAVLTDSPYLKKLSSDLYSDVDVMDTNTYLTNLARGRHVPEILIDGGAVFLKAKTIDEIIKNDNLSLQKRLLNVISRGVENKKTRNNRPLDTQGGGVRNACVFLPMPQSLVISNRYDFELALVLKRKELIAQTSAKVVTERIVEKKEILLDESNINGICLIGHSQLDNWEIKKLAGRKVRNCGIRGISSFEYKKQILDTNLLTLTENDYIVMHGTNDIVEKHTLDEITCSILATIEYIKNRKPTAQIYFLSCAAVNGRLDRSNRKIEELNRALAEKLKSKVVWVDLTEMNDEFGNLRMDYTIDGLHLSEKGYIELKRIVEKIIERNQK